MDISLFLHQYIDFRLFHAQTVELYLIDQVQEGKFEVLIIDNGDAIANKELEQAQKIIINLDIEKPNKYFQYFHKGKNTLQFEFTLKKTVVHVSDLNKTIGFLMVQFPDKELVFTYSSPKGEYILNSKDFIKDFTNEEISSKEFSLYLHEILQNHLDEVIYSDFS